MEILSLVKKDIYPLEITSGGNLGKWIVYMPLVGYAHVVSIDILNELINAINGKSYLFKDEVEAIVRHLNDQRKKIYYAPKDENGLLNMMILPNNKCNFHCSYCYSAYGRSGIEISEEKLYYALNYFLSPQRAINERLTISVLGGGEPLLSWNILRRALDYAYKINADRGKELPISIVTNGSIISDEIIEYCKLNKISLSISFDILEDIQNKQRGSFELVKRNINTFAERGLDIALNTVITNENVDRMNEMVLFMAENLPLVKKVSFKSLISDSYFPTIESREHYYRHFVDNFFEAKDIATEKGIYVTSPYWNAVICLADRYCPGKFVLTAEGTLSICHCVSSSKDILYDKFIFGKVSDVGNIDIYKEKLADILGYNQNKFERCKLCACKWHCAGGCYTDNCTMNDDARNAYCTSMRYFLEKYILKYLIK